MSASPGSGRRPTRAGDTDRPMQIDGIALTHPNKLLWPEDGITKRDLAEYYLAVAPFLLPFMAERALTLRPFPRGIGAPGFYLQNAPDRRPAWLPTWTDIAVTTGRPVDHVVGGDRRTLLWLVQWNAIEVHTWLSRIDDPDAPDFAVIDLDPAETTPFRLVAEVACLFRAALDRAGLASFPKLTGSTGIHVFIPLDRALGFDEVRARMQALCRTVESSAAELVTTDPAIAGRGDRVFADYAQNSRGRTTVAPYSVRPRRGAPVAAPVRWDELDDPTLRADRWSIRTMPGRLAEVGDLVAPMLSCRQRLPDAW